MEQPPNDTYYLYIEIENFVVNSLAASVKLFKIMQQGAEEVSKLTDFEPEQIWPIYKLELG